MLNLAYSKETVIIQRTKHKIEMNNHTLIKNLKDCLSQLPELAELDEFFANNENDKFTVIFHEELLVQESI